MAERGARPRALLPSRMTGRANGAAQAYAPLIHPPCPPEAGRLPRPPGHVRLPQPDREPCPAFPVTGNVCAVVFRFPETPPGVAPPGGRFWSQPQPPRRGARAPGRAHAQRQSRQGGTKLHGTSPGPSPEHDSNLSKRHFLPNVRCFVPLG